MKTHPTPEEWISFLYGEDHGAAHVHARLKVHLLACPECRGQVAAWRQSQKALDAWDIAPPERPGFPGTAVRWAAAAAVLLAIGIGLGRGLSAPSITPRQLQAAVASELDARLASMRAQWMETLDQRQAAMAAAFRQSASEIASAEAQRLLTDYAQLVDQQRELDRQSYLAAFRQLDGQRQADIGSLRGELQTLALHADDDLSRTRQQLLELASSTQPSSQPSNSR